LIQLLVHITTLIQEPENSDGSNGAQDPLLPAGHFTKCFWL